MMNRDLWGSFILSLKPVLAQGAVPLCLQDISIPSLLLISTFVNWPGRNFLSGQVSPQCSVNGRSSLQDTRGIVNISAGECRKLETEYSWSYLLMHFPERLRFCLQIGWTNESRVKQACAPQCLFGAAFCFWRAVPVGETGKYITCKTCISFDLVKVPWCLSYSSFFTRTMTETSVDPDLDWIRWQPQSHRRKLSWTASKCMNLFSQLLNFFYFISCCPQGYSAPLYHTAILLHSNNVSQLYSNRGFH